MQFILPLFYMAFGYTLIYLIKKISKEYPDESPLRIFFRIFLVAGSSLVITMTIMHIFTFIFYKSHEFEPDVFKIISVISLVCLGYMIWLLYSNRIGRHLKIVFFLFPAISIVSRIYQFFASFFS